MPSPTGNTHPYPGTESSVGPDVEVCLEPTGVLHWGLEVLANRETHRVIEVAYASESATELRRGPLGAHVNLAEIRSVWPSRFATTPVQTPRSKMGSVT